MSSQSPSLDPWTQPITLLLPSGTNITLPLSAFDDFRIYTGRYALNYGSQIGASLLLLSVLLLLTRASKRKSAIFLLNAACLLVNTIRCALHGAFITSSLWNAFTQITQDGSRVAKGDVACQAAANVLTFVLFALIMVSLSMQVWVVCITTPRIQQLLIMSTCILTALLATAFKAAAVSLAIRQLLLFQPLERYANILAASYITQAISIWVFSLAFTYKLGAAILQRRKLKMTQFGPMQIVFIMGCKTMLVPAVFSLLQFNLAVPELGAQSLTVVCIFLPLSAIWAGVVNESAVVADRGPDSHHRLIQADFYRSKMASTVRSNATNSTLGKGTVFSATASCTCACAEKSAAKHGSASRGKDSLDGVEDADADAGILVDRSFGFEREVVGADGAERGGSAV